MGHSYVIEQLQIFQTNIAAARSDIIQVDKALKETEEHLQAAQASLKIALSFRQKEEK